MTITVYKTTHDQIYFKLRDEQDAVLLSSINYNSYSRCLEDIYVIQMYGEIDFIVEKCPETKRRKFFVKLSRQRIIAESPEYILERTLKEDISKVIKGLQRAVMIDMTAVRFYKRMRTN
jgi:hypothetical protein